MISTAYPAGLPHPHALAAASLMSYSPPPLLWWQHLCLPIFCSWMATLMVTLAAGGKCPACAVAEVSGAYAASKTPVCTWLSIQYPQQGPMVARPLAAHTHDQAQPYTLLQMHAARRRVLVAIIQKHSFVEGTHFQSWQRYCCSAPPSSMISIADRSCRTCFCGMTMRSNQPNLRLYSARASTAVSCVLPDMTTSAEPGPAPASRPSLHQAASWSKLL